MRTLFLLLSTASLSLCSLSYVCAALNSARSSRLCVAFLVIASSLVFSPHLLAASFLRLCFLSLFSKSPLYSRVLTVLPNGKGKHKPFPSGRCWSSQPSSGWCPLSESSSFCVFFSFLVTCGVRVVWCPQFCYDYRRMSDLVLMRGQSVSFL